MRRSPLLLAAFAIAAALPGTAFAAAVPKVAVGHCELDATNATAVECVVVLESNPNGEWGQDTWDTDGYGSADLVCKLSGSDHIGGPYGFEWHPFPHGADVCTLTLHATDGHSDAYVL